MFVCFFFWLSPSWYLSIFPWCFKTKPLRQPALKIIFIYRWSRKVNAETYSVKISPNLSLLSDEYYYRHFNNRLRQMYKLLSSSIRVVSKYAAWLSCQPHGTDQYQPLFLVENIETRLSVDVRSSSTSHLNLSKLSVFLNTNQCLHYQAKSLNYKNLHLAFTSSLMHLYTKVDKRIRIHCGIELSSLRFLN